VADYDAVLFHPAMRAGWRVVSLTLHNAILDTRVTITMVMSLSGNHACFLSFFNLLWDLVSSDGGVGAVTAD
jgi:hypothetical protein